MFGLSKAAKATNQVAETFIRTVSTDKKTGVLDGKSKKYLKAQFEALKTSNPAVLQRLNKRLTTIAKESAGSDDWSRGSWTQRAQAAGSYISDLQIKNGLL